MSKRLTLIILIIAFYQNSFAIEVKFVNKILLSQEKYTLFNVVNFVTTEDEMFILLDTKASNIKLYDNGGKLHRVWGRRGPGPDEFIQPFRCDYQEPYFILYDLGKFRLNVYKRAGKTKFESVSSTRVNHIWECRLWKDKVMIAGYIRKKNGKQYALYMHDLANNKIEYLLPSYMKYGFKSESEYKRKYKNITPLGSNSYIHCGKEHIYHAWDCRLSIAKINIQTKEIQVFGKKTRNFKPPKITKAWWKAHRERDSKKVKKEKRRFSFISGLFGDENIMGLLYRNYDEELSGWRVALRLYSAQGDFLYEGILSEVVHYPEWSPPFFYNQENGCLYIISKQLTEDFMDRCEIVKYKIKR